MPVQDRPISEFPRALEVLATALVLISNPSGVDTYDSNSCTLTELGKTILDIEYTQELGQMSVFEAILNVRVLSGTTDPTSAVGVDNQLYVKYQTIGGVDSVVAVYVKLDGDWVEIQTGGSGASVTLGTTVPSDSTGSDGDLYVQYEALTYKVVEYFVKINGSWRKAPYSRVVALTQAEYDLITPDTTTLYIITDAQSSYQTKTDANLQTTADTVVGAINELNTNKADTSDIPSFSVMAGLSAQTGITNLNGGSLRIGTARLLNHNIRVDSAVSVNQKIIQLANTTDYPANNSYIMLISPDGNYRLTASTSGGFFATSVVPTGEYNIMGFYLT